MLKVFNYIGVFVVVSISYSSGFPVRGNASVSVELEGNGTNAQIQHNITMVFFVTICQLHIVTIYCRVKG